MNEKIEDKKKSYREDLHKMIIFFVILVAILIFLFLVKLFIVKKDISFNLPLWIKNRLSILYIISFGLFSGILVFFGIESFDNLLNRYFPGMALTNLTSVTMVIGFCFIYSAFIKEILEKVFNTKLVINVWENVVGYVVIRGFVILVLYFVLKNKNIKNTIKE